MEASTRALKHSSSELQDVEKEILPFLSGTTEEYEELRYEQQLSNLKECCVPSEEWKAVVAKGNTAVYTRKTEVRYIHNPLDRLSTHSIIPSLNINIYIYNSLARSLLASQSIHCCKGPLTFYLLYPGRSQMDNQER